MMKKTVPAYAIIVLGFEYVLVIFAYVNIHLHGRLTACPKQVM